MYIKNFAPALSKILKNNFLSFYVYKAFLKHSSVFRFYIYSKSAAVHSLKLQAKWRICCT